MTVPASFATALLLPVLLHLLGGDLLLLPVAVVWTASLLRSGTTLLDRLVLGAVLVTGSLVSLGLLLSLWPWGLQPLPLGWLLLGLPALASWRTGRRPQLPRRVELSDAVVLGAAAVAGWAAFRPLRGRDPLQRLELVANQLDRMAHFALFDTIRQRGSYTFLDQDAARLRVKTPTEAVYPQGAHFLDAVVETLARSGSRAGTGVAELDRYFVLVLLAYVVLVASLVWAARWVAGPQASQPGRLFAALLAAAFALGGPLAALIAFGADSQVVGLTAVALVAALVVRPLEHPVEQLLLAAAATVLLVYSYNLYAPLAVLGFALALLLQRFPFRQRWRPLVAIGVPAAAVAATPLVFTLTATFDVRAQALVAGVRIPLATALVVLLGGLALVPLLTGLARRGGIAAGLMAQLVAVAVTVGGFAVLADRSSSYYYAKLVAAGYVALVPCLGALGMVRHRGRSPVGSRWVTAASAAALVTVAATLQLHVPGTFADDRAEPYQPLVRWSSGEQRAYFHRRYVALDRLGVLGDRQDTLVVVSRSGAQNAGTTFFVGSLNGDLGVLQQAMEVLKAPATGPAARGNGPPLDTVLRAVAAVHRPVRVLVADPVYGAELTQALAARPDLRATVRVEPGIAAP